MKPAPSLLLTLAVLSLFTPSAVLSQTVTAQSPPAKQPSPQTSATEGENFAALRQKAEQGDARAQYSLGVVYDSGEGVKQDYAAAASWYRKAAEQGDPGAQYNLGSRYDNGQGVTQDYGEAHKWYNVAASRAATAEDQKRFASARERVAEKMTPAQVAEAQKRAREWMAAFEKRKK